MFGQSSWKDTLRFEIQNWGKFMQMFFSSTKCMQMLFLCLSSAGNKIYKILNVKARGRHKYLIEDIAHLNHSQQLLEICDRKYSIHRKRKYPKYRCATVCLGKIPSSPKQLPFQWGSYCQSFALIWINRKELLVHVRSTQPLVLSQIPASHIRFRYLFSGWKKEEKNRFCCEKYFALFAFWHKLWLKKWENVEEKIK